MISTSVSNIKMKQKSMKHARRSFKKELIKFPVLFVASLLVIASASFPAARADTIEQQIKALQAENASNQNAINDLQSQAVSYQDAINRLNAQINLLQRQIDDNTSKQQVLQQQIQQKQVELEQQRVALGQDIKSMYVNDDMSTVEMLATSKDLNHFVDAETYRSAVQARIQAALADIARIQGQLKSQKDQVAELLNQQRNQQTQLASARGEQNRLLSLNSSQQAAYNDKTKANQDKIANLVAEQLRLNSAGAKGPLTRDPSNGYYPYANWPFSMSTAPGCVDGDGPDRWGYCTRQCVSYAAWAVERSGRQAPTYYGNAKNWVAAARSQGVPVFTSDPKPGDVAISTAGTWGHAMYVEKVSGDMIYISQYNASLTGEYSLQWREWGGYYFLRFP